MKSITIAFDEAVTLLRQAVEDRGASYQYVKPENARYCMYTDEEGTGPGCIIGWVLFAKGADASFFEGVSSEGHDLKGTGVDDLIKDEKVVVDDRTASLLSVVQSLQDQQMPWSEAVRRGLAQSGVI